MKSLLTGASLCMALLPSPLFAQGLQLTTDAEKSPALLLSKDTVDVPYETPFANVALQTNAGKFTLEAGKDATWVTPRAEANGNYTFFCTPHYDATQPRLAHFTLKSADGKISRPLVIRQLPNTSAASMADIMLPIASATAESEQPGEGIELSYDGDPSTIYHSSWGGCSLPQNLTYTLKEAAHIDYLVYTPRTGSPNGTFGEVEVFVAKAEKPNEWKSVAKADCEKKNSSSTILLGEKGIDQVKKVRIQVNTAGNDGSKNFVSCAEMAFYQYNASLTAGLSEYFADALCTSLKGISSEADLVKIGHPYLRQLAYNLLQGNYSTQFRVGEFSCYMNRGTLQQKLKTSAGYDPYENPTGIYFKKDDVIVVFAEGIHPNMLKAAVEAKAEGICHPIILGNDEAIEKLAKELDLSLEGIEIVNLRHPGEAPRRERYARILSEKRAREGVTYEEANDKMFERNYFGMMMVETGEADAFITGLYTKYSNTIKVAKEVIGIRPEYKHFGTMHILNSKAHTSWQIR